MRKFFEYTELTILTIMCLVLSLTLTYVDSDDIYKILRNFVISFSIMIGALIFSFVCYKRRKLKSGNNLQFFINNIIIFCHFLYLTFLYNIHYGYGRTIGILGYRKNLGICTAFHIPCKISFLLFYFSQIIIFILFILKTKEKLVSLNKNIKLQYTIYLIGYICFILYIIFLIIKSFINDDNYRQLITLSGKVLAYGWIYNIIISILIKFQRSNKQDGM